MECIGNYFKSVTDGLAETTRSEGTETAKHKLSNFTSTGPSSFRDA